MNPIGWVLGLQGPTLIAVICALIFVEELGVPLPFAPGDIVLAIAGIAIAGGRVDAAALVVSIAVVSVSGAMLGREIAALIGWQRLMRIAEPLHFRGPLERASGLLRRGGSRAVFTARLIPGLRVYTTQVAGVSDIPRSTFIGGLLPATVVYVAAFVGLGAAVGRPVLALIHEAERQLLLAAGLILAVVIVLLLTRAPVRRALASLYATGWTGPLKLRIDSVRLTFILGALGLNFAGHAVALGLKLPLFLDSTGTIFAGIIAGPWIGASVGFISNLISSNTVDPIAGLYSIVSFAVGFSAGLAGYLNWHKRWSGWIGLWLICFSVAAVISTPLNFLVSGGKSGISVGDSVYAYLTGLHVPGLLAAFLGEALVDLPDKFLTVFAALLIVQGIRQPQSTAPAATTELDLAEAFTFVVRSEHWVRRLAAAAVCVLFAVLVVPYLLLSGYLIELSRRRRAGLRGLPPWDHRWTKLKDGFRINVVLFAWIVPGILVAIPGAILSSLQERPGTTTATLVGSAADAVAAIGSLWFLFVLLLEPAIFTQFLDRGIRGALNLRAVIRRLRVSLGLSVVVGMLVIVLTTVGVLGLLGLLIGVLVTLPYASLVGAYLVGYYAELTDRTLQPARSSEPVSL
ncbi:MAG TPA: DUF4013 domain-containing protein [Candidatus Dormibacteraeota bacterium]|nr:DUF4013 domain-containing protein [Candidatus Dormibacteraeota bacterium]